MREAGYEIPPVTRVSNVMKGTDGRVYSMGRLRDAVHETDPSGVHYRGAMTGDLIRSEWSALRDRLDTEARGAKMSQAAVVELSHRYASLDAESRGVVDERLSEWVLSDDENRRFDALALVSDHRIVRALPSLRQLLVRLQDAKDPGAPYEQAKVRRIMARLDNGAPGQA